MAISLLGLVNEKLLGPSPRPFNSLKEGDPLYQLRKAVRKSICEKQKPLLGNGVKLQNASAHLPLIKLREGSSELMLFGVFRSSSKKGKLHSMTVKRDAQDRRNATTSRAEVGVSLGEQHLSGRIGH